LLAALAIVDGSKPSPGTGWARPATIPEMIFSWLRTRRRRKLLAEPFPIRWERFLAENVGHFPLLSPAEQARLRDTTRILVAEKLWEGGRGLFVTEEMKVTIAAEAALLLLGDDHGYFADVPSVVVYPSAMRNPVLDEGWEDDEISDGEIDGQASYRGPVLVSWDVVKEEARDPGCGTNLVVHEFAHQLDNLDGEINGTPDLEPELATRWKYGMTVALRDHRRAIDDYEKRGGEEPFLSDQAAETEEEFFADASEAFYCAPHDLKAEYPQVFELFVAYYKIDPTRWFPEPS
jgi:Mlc titration factor MtfA (ptsG expression regulator)